ncbi:hypothetical protein EK21DRAFT_75694 [Setomelanomma holmii]|uniref:Uncharacterized protein n=1 Tax=Setomelanomma holmii TaxID=210430 RepID=A0A9P4LHQ5_9PLEO|nr:hypothetical protein EK21DRAFT_75694 [Setomelanomma holmii]
MPPKKDTNGSDATKLLVGFDDKETKLLAAAFMSCIGPDKYDYDLMATLTGNTNGSLKKMWPPIKKKAIDAHPSFATFIGSTGSNITAPAPKAKTAGGRKRKASTDTDSATADVNKSDGNKSDSKPEPKKKAAAAKGKGRTKKAKKEEDDEKVKSEEDSADGGDGLGQYTRKKKVLEWLKNADGALETIKKTEEEV